MLVNKQQWCAFLCSLAMLLSCASMLFPAASNAQTSLPIFTDTSNSDCATGNGIVYSVALPALSEGQVLYIKTDASNLETNISVFMQSDDGSCSLIKTVKANDSSWVRVSRITPEFAGEKNTAVLSSNNLGANIYASVATILVVDSGDCQRFEQLECIGDYEGTAGAVEPVTVSAPGEFVTIQSIPDITDESIKYVEYYDGGDFLYVTPEIEAVRREYLRGGERTIKKVVYLTNDRLVTVTEKIQMPKDPLYSQYIRSSIYRLGGQARFLAALVLFVAGIFILRWIVRRWHAWRTYKTGHGIDAYLRTHQKND